MASMAHALTLPSMGVLDAKINGGAKSRRRVAARAAGCIRRKNLPLGDNCIGIGWDPLHMGLLPVADRARVNLVADFTNVRNQLKSSRRVMAFLQRSTLLSGHVRGHTTGQSGRLSVRCSADFPDSMELDPSLSNESSESKEELCTTASTQSMAKLGVYTSLALVLPAVITAQASAKVAQKVKKKAKVPKAVPTMQLEERKQWVQGLPRIDETIPYTEVLELREADKVKHIIKHPNSRLKERPERVLVVLEDDRVVRCVLPPPDRDEQFWTNWESMELNSLLIDAFSPAIPPAKVEGWAGKGPSLTFLYKIQDFFRKRKSSTSKGAKGSKSTNSRLEELAKARREMELERKNLESETRRLEAQRIQDMKKARAQAQMAREQAERVRKKRGKLGSGCRKTAASNATASSG